MISFIVPAHDEAAQIGAVVAALRAAGEGAGEAFEIVVVDDSSTDATAAIAAAAGARVVRAEVRQIAGARNAGARVASGDLFVFVDGDTFVDALLVRAAREAIEHGAVAGGALTRFDSAPWYGHVVMELVTRLLRAKHMCCGCFLFARRDAFESVGGFDEQLFASEELVLARALRERGPFVVLKRRVITSGRKLRDLPLRFHFQQLAHLVRGGARAVRTREGLEFWYGRRA